MLALLDSAYPLIINPSLTMRSLTSARIHHRRISGFLLLGLNGKTRKTPLCRFVCTAPSAGSVRDIVGRGFVF